MEKKVPITRVKLEFGTCRIQVKLIKLDVENSFSNKCGGIIPELYKERGVNRYYIDCITEDGKKIKLHSVMSGKKAQYLDDNGVKINKNVTIVYGALSKIIIRYEDKDDLSRKMNMMF